MSSPSQGQSWIPAYVADRDALLLARVRLASNIILPIVVGITVCNAVVDTATAATRGALAVPFLVLSLAGTVAGRTHPFPDWGRCVAFGFMLLLTACAATTWRAFPQDAALVPVYVLTLLMASVLLFPWGVGLQAVASVFALGCYVWAMGGITTRFHGSVLIVLSGMMPVMLVGAGVFDRNRRATFERTWQKEQMVSLARALAEHVDPSEVIRTVLDHGVPLLAADWASVALYDPRKRLYRLVALAGPRADPGWMGFEFPADLMGTPERVASGVFVLPTDDPGHVALRILREQGTRHALYANLRHQGEGLGLLGFGRESGRPFVESERLLARGLADQTSLALRTARLVTELREANQLKVEFVSTMSHELRTPLNVILGYADMAREGLLDAAGVPVGECLGRIEAAGRDLLELIESTLEIGRLEAQRDEVRLEPVGLPAFWHEVGNACARLARNPAVVLDWRRSPASITIHTDPRKLTIVLRNLVGNALKFTDHGHVRVESQRLNGELHLSVEDTGIGIHPRDQEAIFEMFRQADGSDSRRYGGTGLGLYIVRRFVEQLGGRVVLESTPGVGSRFTVILPAPVAGTAAAAA